MKKFLAINFNKNLVKKGLIFAIALAVVIGMSYFGSRDYLDQSIMHMLCGAKPPTGIQITWLAVDEKHVKEKHVDDPGIDPHASKFEPCEDWKALAQDAVDNPTKSKIQDDGDYRYDKNMGRKIGHQDSNPQEWIRVIVRPDCDHTGVTTFPENPQSYTGC